MLINASQFPGPALFQAIGGIAVLMIAVLWVALAYRRERKRRDEWKRQLREGPLAWGKQHTTSAELAALLENAARNKKELKP